MALQVFPEDWDRALAIVAHPDDMEYGAASAVARWTDQGKDVRYLLVTRGEAGIASLPPSEVGPARVAEQQESCRLVGVEQLEFLDRPDGLVVADLALRRDLAEAIRRHRPEVVLSINFRESWGGPSWNHADHRAVGRGVLDAIRDAGNPWLFEDGGAEAWNGVRFAAFSGSPQPSHGVDVGDTIDRGIASLLCHELYLQNLGGDMANAGDFLRNNAQRAGPDLDVEYATTFELINF